MMQPSKGRVSDVPTPVLRGDTISVWRVSTAFAGAAEALRALLAPDERDRADRMPDPVARARFVVTRASLRRLLAHELGGDPIAFELRYGATGKPFLVRRGEADALRFSVSHAGDLALIALCRGRDVGVDIESVRRPRYGVRIAERLFDAATCRLLDGLPPADWTDVFLHAWTQREAFVKAVGGSIFGTEDPLAFRWPRPHHDVQRVRDGDEWTVAVLTPGAGYVASLVARGVADRIDEHHWNPLDGG
jgi:4'-phosphopantetheinyl transferase